METVKVHKSVYWEHKSIAAEKKTSIWNNLIVLNNKLLLNKAALPYFQVAIQCALFLPLVIVIIGYYHSSFSVITVIFIAFFANILACIDKPGARSINTIFAFAVMDLLMLFMFLIR